MRLRYPPELVGGDIDRAVASVDLALFSLHLLRELTRGDWSADVAASIAAWDLA